MTDPIVKWPGGKRWLVDTLLRLVRPGDRLIEPFAGGMALSLAYRGAAIASDTNKRLIEMYEAVRDTPNAVIYALEHLIARYDQARDKPEFYYLVRTCFNIPQDTPAVRAARLLFLNRTCFNGLYRENKLGEFNVPHGRHKSPPSVRPEAIYAASGRLKGIELMRLTFSAVLMIASEGDTVYLDPPYDGGFAEYTADRFSWDAQRWLAHWASRAAARGAKVIASNANTSRVRELWSDFGFEILELQGPRSISRDGAGRGKVGELLMVRG